MTSIKTDPKFYKKSYVVYLLVSIAKYPRLIRKGRQQDPNAWTYIVYPQFIQKELHKGIPKYKIVNNAFIFIVIIFVDGDYAKRILVGVFSKVTQVGSYFMQFNTFTYI